MDFGDITTRGLVLLGCGKMGSAMLEGWLKGGLSPASVWVLDPAPSDWLKAQGVHLNEALPDDPAVMVVAVKPQMMGDALLQVAAKGGGETVVLSIAAGTTIATFEKVFGAGTPVIRAMPNTPAAIGRGITALIANAHVGDDRMTLAETLLRAVGKTVRLESEDQMDAAGFHPVRRRRVYDPDRLRGKTARQPPLQHRASHLSAAQKHKATAGDISEIHDKTSFLGDCLADHGIGREANGARSR
jgi:hypothetical protein